MRRQKCIRGFLAFCTVMVFTSTVDAAIISYSVQKGGFFEQAAADTAPTVDRYDYLLGITTTSAGDVAQADVAFSGIAPPVDLMQGPPPGEATWAAGANFPSQAALDAAIPFTTATFSISGGTLGAGSADLDISADLYPNTIPRIDAASFNGLQGIDPSADFTLSFNGFTPSAGVTQAVTGILFAALDDSGSGSILAMLPTDTEILIPAGTFLTNKEYTLALSYQQFVFSTPTEMGPFLGTIGSYEGSHATTVHFQTAPEPATGILVVAGSLIAIRRRRRM